MPIISTIIRLASSSAGNDSIDHISKTEQSPLHILPAPVLVLLALACLMLAACVAGLTLGLMSLDTMGLEIIMQSNDEQHARAARLIKPVREQGNLLLVTLLFANTVATELLPLVLEALVPGGYFSLFVSVGSIMLFGEIIPQAVCSRHALLIGSHMIGFVKVLRTILYPISAPIAYMLDVMLGDELGKVYNRDELKGLIDVHLNNEVLTQDETTILKATLEFSRKTVHQILTPAKNVFKLDIDSHLNRDTLLRLLRSGHSRVPLYDGNPSNIVCLLLVKQLVLVNPDDSLPIRSLISKKKRNHKIRVAPALECAGSTLIADLLNEFQKGRSHMAIVYDDISKHSSDRKFLGIVSIEDIIEEILHEEIIDETDAFMDNTNRTKVLVRNANGRLVRTTTLKTHTLHRAGTSSAVVVKEVDVPTLRKPLGEKQVGSKMRPDWKPKKKKASFAEGDSRETPLLAAIESGDVEQGLQVRQSGELPEDLSLEITPQMARRTPGQTSYDDIRYALIPGQSSHSLFGEDDNIIPEDLAPRSAEASPTVLGQSASQTMSLRNLEVDVSKQLQVRPLPEDASAERVVRIPQSKRVRSPSASLPTLKSTWPSYGTVEPPGKS